MGWALARLFGFSWVEDKHLGCSWKWPLTKVNSDVLTFRPRPAGVQHLPGRHSLRDPGRQGRLGGRHQEREGPLFCQVREKRRAVSEVNILWSGLLKTSVLIVRVLLKPWEVLDCITKQETIKMTMLELRNHPYRPFSIFYSTGFLSVCLMYWVFCLFWVFCLLVFVAFRKVYSIFES